MARLVNLPPWEGPDLPMRSILVCAVALCSLVALPASAGTLSVFESSLGSPGATALFAPGTGLVADVDLDASSAEGGNLFGGASEIHIVPLGDAILTAFTCELATGCDDQFTFVSGGAGVGYVTINDGDVFTQTGFQDLGLITWNSAGSGGLYLTGCNYTSPDSSPTERTCSPFTIAQTPEPGTGVLIGVALAAIGFARRGR
jgi:PEP-CTERM motif-containing protein